MGRDNIPTTTRRDEGAHRGPGILEKGGFFDRLIHGRSKEDGGTDVQRSRMPDSRVPGAEKCSPGSACHPSQGGTPDKGGASTPSPSATGAERVRAYFRIVQSQYSDSAWKGMSSDQKYNAAIRHLTKTGQVDDFRASIQQRNTGVRPAGEEVRVAHVDAKMRGAVFLNGKAADAYSMNPDGSLTKEASASRVGLLGAPLITRVTGFPGNDGLGGSQLRVFGITLSRKGDQTGDMYTVDRAVSKGMKISIAGIGDAQFRQAAAQRQGSDSCCSSTSSSSSATQGLDPRDQVRSFYKETKAGYSAAAWAKLSDDKKFDAVEARFGKAFTDAVRQRDAIARRSN